MQTQKHHSIGDSFLGLATAVISRALADLPFSRSVIGTGDRVRDEAMAWINSPECEALCYALDFDYKAIQQRAADLYRHFLKSVDNSEKAPRKPRKHPGHSGIPLSEVKPHGGTVR
jgi:hypothetical protein